MSDNLCITIRFLNGTFHGRADQGEPEWPPSPLRLYQAIVAASAARWNERRGLRYAEPALKWMEQFAPPLIIAPQAKETHGYQIYVPDNTGDNVGRSLSRGGDDSIAEYRTEKVVRPMLISSEEAIHYIWRIADLPQGIDEYQDVVFGAVGSITHLGWGVDQVIASTTLIPHASLNQLHGEHWHQDDDAPTVQLRSPKCGSYDDLARRHQAFLNRVEANHFAPVPPLANFHITGYRRTSDPVTAPHAIFALRTVDGGKYQRFDTVRRSLHVAGMLRHTASQHDFLRSVGLSVEDGRSLVLGHGESLGESHKAVNGPRLSFVPLPSIEYRGGKQSVVGPIRRVLITQHGEGNKEIFKRIIQRLESRELIDEKNARSIALLQRLPVRPEGAVDSYLRSSSTWSTVTPVVLPGYDDVGRLRQRLKPGNTLSAEEKGTILEKLDKRIDFLLRKAIRQAGYPETLALNANLEWSSSGFLPGLALASQYAAGDQHRRYRRLHVKVTWYSPDGSPLRIKGPLCFGSGRFTGMGLFAAST